VSVSGGYLACATEPDGEIIVRDMASATTRRFKEQINVSSNDAQITALALSVDGTMLALAATDGIIRLRQIPSNRLTATLYGHTKPIDALAFSSDGRKLASGSMDATVRIWDIENRSSEGLLLKSHTATVYSVSFSADGRTLASASRDGTVKLWNTVAGQEMVTFFAHRQDLGDGVWVVTFSSDGARLLSGGESGTIISWEGSSETPRAVSAASDRRPR
jgi:WD40 repeat protein